MTTASYVMAPRADPCLPASREFRLAWMPAPGGESIAASNARGKRMDARQILSQVAAALAVGEIEVVDLTGPLGPQTPLIKLPPEIGKNTPAIEIHAISRYDQDGPFWAWN